MRVPILIMLLGVSFTSCIKDPLPECPYQYSIQLSVKHKNYSNSSTIDADMVVDEDLPFGEYVSNIVYTLRNVNTGESILDEVINVIASDGKEIELIIDRIPDGEYRLTVWGNVENTVNSVGSSFDLHKDNAESTDIYWASDILTIKAGIPQEKSLQLERTKGKLMVVFNDLADHIVQIKKTVTSVYQKVDHQGSYSEKTDIEKIFLKNAQPLERVSTYLAPSMEGENSILSLSLYTADDHQPACIIPSIEIKINKNEITAVTINYNSLYGQLEIWIYINNEWTLIKELIISEL